MWAVQVGDGLDDHHHVLGPDLEVIVGFVGSSAILGIGVVLDPISGDGLLDGVLCFLVFCQAFQEHCMVVTASQCAVRCLARAGIIGTFVMETASQSAIYCLTRAGIISPSDTVMVGWMSQTFFALFIPQMWLGAGWRALFRDWWREGSDQGQGLGHSLSCAQK